MTVTEPAPPPPHLSRFRIVGARVLTLTGLLLVWVSLMAVFVRYELLDNNTFRDTSQQLVQSKAIQAQLTARAVQVLYQNVDVDAQIRKLMPKQQAGLSSPIAAGFRGLAGYVTGQLLATPAVQNAVVTAVTNSHDQLVELLHDKNRFVRVEGGLVSLDLRRLVHDLSVQLGLPPDVSNRIPDSAARIPVIRANELGVAQRAVNALDFVASWLWALILVAWALAVYLVPGRRRQEIRAIAIGFVVVGVLVLLVRRLAGVYVVDHLVNTATARPAARDAYDIVTRHLRDTGWTDVMVGVAALVGVWLVGPRTRAQIALRWLAPYLRRPVPVYGIFVLLWLLLLLWGPTVQFHRPFYILLMVVFSAIGVEVVRRIAARRYPGAEATHLGTWALEWWAGLRYRLEQMSDAAVAPAGARPAAVAVPAAVPAPAAGDASELERLAALHDGGKLTDEEFAAAKRRVLGLGA